MLYSLVTRKHKYSKIGVEITSRFMRAVELNCYKGQYYLLNCTAVPLTGGNGETESQAQLVEVLQRMKAGPNTKIISSLPYAEVIVRNVTVDNKLRDWEIYQLVRKKAASHFNHNPNEFLVDFEKINVAPKEILMDIRWVVTRRQDVETKVKLFKKADLMLSAIDVDVLAVLRAVTFLANKSGLAKKRLMVIKLNADGVIILVMEANQILFIREEFYSLQQEAVRQNAVALAEFIVRIIKLYIPSDIHAVTAKIWLAGEFNAMTELSQNLAASILMAVEVINPFQFLVPRVDFIIQDWQERACEFLTCCGLAMR